MNETLEYKCNWNWGGSWKLRIKFFRVFKIFRERILLWCELFSFGNFKNPLESI